MVRRALTLVVAMLALVVVLAILAFGGKLLSYSQTSVRLIQKNVQRSMPLELDLERARMMVDQIIPDLKENIHVIAREEVEVAHLQNQIRATEKHLALEKRTLTNLRDRLLAKSSDRTATQTVAYFDEAFADDASSDLTIKASMADDEPSRQLTNRLARKFDQFKQRKSILASKQRLLETRQTSLRAAKEILEQTRARKADLENQIELLVAQHRLLKAESVGKPIEFNSGSFARADSLLAQISQRMEVARRVMTHEAETFSPTTITHEFDQDELLGEIEEHLQLKIERE